MPFLRLPGKPPVVNVVLSGAAMLAPPPQASVTTSTASPSGMASATLSVGLAVLITVANDHAAGQVGIAHLPAVAEGIRLAFWLAAGGIFISLLAALTLPRKASVIGL